MDKRHIINEIHRTTVNGKALGQNLFAKETGIKAHQWQGKYWARWGDAVSEAGYSQNEWNSAFVEAHVIECLLQLTRTLGKFPTKYEIQLEKASNSAFPGLAPIRRLGNRVELKAKLIQYCRTHPDFADIEATLQVMSAREDTNSSGDESHAVQDAIGNGYVYLVSAQKAHKIGCTRAPYRRVAEIANQSANGAKLLHLIATDDPEGIEDYWHRRFNDKRIVGVNKQSGEWFQLSAEEIKAFKHRKTM